MQNTRNLNPVNNVAIQPNLPPVDIFTNPEKTAERDAIVEPKQSQSKDYFATSDMGALYANLFHLLWHSTLPFVEGSLRVQQFMMKSCEVAGVKIECGKLFQRIPTDSGMCCALNSEHALRDTEYSNLVKVMQGKNVDSQNPDQKAQVYAKVGRNNGVRLTMDLHSNNVSFGSISEDFNAFSVSLEAQLSFLF